MADNDTTNLRRELTKARETLRAAEVHLTHHAAMNAALHLSDKVMYSPLHAKVQATIHGIDLVLVATENTSDTEDSCVHCHEKIFLRGPGNWVHHHGLGRCQSQGVPYGHLAHPESVPCRAEQPNPCRGASDG